MARKENNIHYLYKTMCVVTNKYYVGMHSTVNLNDGYLGSGKRLRYSIRKYGKDNHKIEILEFFETRDLLIEAEKLAITIEMINDPKCMNLKEGGTGGFVNKEHQVKATNGYVERLKTDLEFKKKIADRMSKVSLRNHKEGKCKYYHLGFKGKQHTDQTKLKMSEAKRGKGIGETNSQFGTCWVTKEGGNKKIKKEELDTSIQEGWVIGRHMV